MAHTKSKWVIVFLIYADFRKSVEETNDVQAFNMTQEMKATLNQMFKDILTVPLDPERARMYVIMNSLDYKESGDSLTKSKTLLYTIGNPHHLKYNQITCCKVLDSDTGSTEHPNSKHPVQNPEFLKRILKENIPVDTEQEDVFFITWDHGSAFGMFREIEAAVVREPVFSNVECYPYLAEFYNRALKEEPVLQELVERQKNKAFPGLVQIRHTLFKVENASGKEAFSKQMNPMVQTSIPVINKEGKLDTQNLFLIYNEQGNAFEISEGKPPAEEFTKREVARLNPAGIREILRNEELAQCFEHWLGEGRLVSVLLMMNCWMMNLHTMYSLQKTVQCLIAPQGNIGTPGYNYKDILRFLFRSDNLHISPQQLAIECVRKSESKRMRRRSKRLRTDREDKVDFWKIFAMDLQAKDSEEKAIFQDQMRQFKKIIHDLISTTLQITNDTTAQNVAEAISLYRDIRSVSFDFTKVNTNDEEEVFIVDFVNWLKALHYLGISKREDEFYPLGTALLSQIIMLCNQIKLRGIQLHETEGHKIYPSDAAILTYPPSGYGLFFPQHKCTSKNLFQNVQKDSLLNDPSFTWSCFIKAVYPEDLWRSYFEA